MFCFPGNNGSKKNQPETYTNVLTIAMNYGDSVELSKAGWDVNEPAAPFWQDIIHWYAKEINPRRYYIWKSEDENASYVLDRMLIRNMFSGIRKG